MEKVLDFGSPLDVSLLDRIMAAAARTGTEQEFQQAHKVLAKFQEHPQAWTRASVILESSQRSDAKFFALKLLEDMIKYRWKSLAPQERDGIKNYTIQAVLKLSQSDGSLKNQKFIISKLNLVLIQILKQEWPQNWGSFIQDLVDASRKSETVCENNMLIFKLLSEEVFDFSEGEMTQAKTKKLKETYNRDFFLVYQLCEYVLKASNRHSLLYCTLDALSRFLTWIPLGYVFETSMVELLIVKFFPSSVPEFRNLAIQCLSEISNLQVDAAHDPQFERMFIGVMEQLVKMMPVQTNFAEVYEKGGDVDREFVSNLAVFFVNFFVKHLKVVEKEQHKQMLLVAHQYLLSISRVQDRELFKTCLEYWQIFTKQLYYEAPVDVPNVGHAVNTPRRQLYSGVLSNLRNVFICNMAKPEEVIVVENENGEVVREKVKNSTTLFLYKVMRESLVYLTHLNYEDTQNQMIEKLEAQVNGSEWSWHNLNTLCWAIGSIPGAQSKEMEKRFLVIVIKDLLGLCEMKRGKDNKAIIASNIMYIVGQYPRFLTDHWKFLKTVVNKLFEFMHETHPGVQDMACDTLLKIAKKCRHKFVVVQLGCERTHLEEILDNLRTHISDLSNQQIYTFYEAIGLMVAVVPDPQKREEMVRKFMELPNRKWSEVMAAAKNDVNHLQNIAVIRSVGVILKTNVAACTSLGHSYISQLSWFFLELLSTYKYYSEQISQVVSSGGQYVTKTPQVRAMRVIKKETLKLLEKFISRSEDVQTIVQKFLPPLLEAVLLDYKAGNPDARDAEVLSLIATTINKLKDHVTPFIPGIFDAVFECTITMITKNFEDFPEHRVEFFSLLKAVNNHCFKAFFMMPPQSFKFIIDAVVWAFKHTMRNIAETGLTILSELFQNMEKSNTSNAFFQRYFLTLLNDLFVVLTDTFHKHNFASQADILRKMFIAVEEGHISAPLWDAQKVSDPNMNNPKFLRQYVANLLTTSFKNLTQSQVKEFVVGLFAKKDPEAFRGHLRDFLVNIKEFGGGDNNAELFRIEKEKEQAQAQEEQTKREMAIPGMIAPHDPRREQMAE